MTKRRGVLSERGRPALACCTGMDELDRIERAVLLAAARRMAKCDHSWGINCARLLRAWAKEIADAD